MDNILEKLVKRFVHDLEEEDETNTFVEFFHTLRPYKRRTAAKCFAQMAAILQNEILTCKHEHTSFSGDVELCEGCAATRTLDKSATELNIYPTWSEWTI